MASERQTGVGLDFLEDVSLAKKLTGKRYRFGENRCGRLMGHIVFPVVYLPGHCAEVSTRWAQMR